MTIDKGFSRSAAVTASLVFFLALNSCVVVPHGEKGAQAATSANSGEFDSVGYVAENWNDKVLPELVAKAADLGAVLGALKADAEAARARFGVRQEESAPYTFIVKGEARIRTTDLESSAATAELDLVAPTPDSVVALQIGPVIRTSSVRDSLLFIHFGDFTNQVDFANLSRALNTKVKEAVVADLDRDHLAGKTVSFTGTFSEDPSGKVLITPVLLEVKK